MQRFQTLLVSTAVAALSACGGGGDSATPTPTAGAPLTISASNYERAAIESAAAGREMLDLGVGGSSLLGVDAQPTVDWVAIGRRELGRAKEVFSGGAGETLVGAVTTRTIGCRNYSIDDKNNNRTFDAGDSLSVSANQCVEAGDTVSGVVTIALNSQTGDLSSSVYTADLTIGFSGLKVVSSSMTATADGSLRLNSAYTSATSGRDTISTSGFQASALIGGTTYSRTLTDFAGTVVTQGAEWTTTLSGTVTSSALDGRSLTIATPIAFKQRISDAYPYAGVATVTGASGGKATLTTLSTSQVSISLDANGDGTAETNVVKAWSAIQ